MCNLPQSALREAGTGWSAWTHGTPPRRSASCPQWRRRGWLKGQIGSVIRQHSWRTKRKPTVQWRYVSSPRARRRFCKVGSCLEFKGGLEKNKLSLGPTGVRCIVYSKWGRRESRNESHLFFFLHLITCQKTKLAACRLDMSSGKAAAKRPETTSRLRLLFHTNIPACTQETRGLVHMQTQAWKFHSILSDRCPTALQVLMLELLLPTRRISEATDR